MHATDLRETEESAAGAAGYNPSPERGGMDHGEFSPVFAQTAEGFALPALGQHVPHTIKQNRRPPGKAQQPPTAPRGAVRKALSETAASLNPAEILRSTRRHDAKTGW